MLFPHGCRFTRDHQASTRWPRPQLVRSVSLRDGPIALHPLNNDDDDDTDADAEMTSGDVVATGGDGEDTSPANRPPKCLKLVCMSNF